MAMPNGYYTEKRKRKAEAVVRRERVRYHPDDPRAYCHCRLERRPVAECETGVCKKVPPPTKEHWETSILDDGVSGLGYGNRWSEPRKRSG